MHKNEMITTYENTLGRRESYGTVRYTNEVLAAIAGFAAADVPGVSKMSGSLIDGVTEFLGMENVSKGIRVTAGDKEVAVEAAIVAEYGRSIPVIAQSIRSNIVRAIESMTGLNVTKVDVRIQKLDMSAVGNEAAAYA
ncbi:hypothetical protein CE91St36_22450 [Christensenellaceae bacterium]|nr:hypothetical protein CE91St36_22450 [Christensenellaceae bacterium]BDF62093.1 hypothetical protein CE91St37_22430 [Christensenellaceae bacterium]